MDDQQDLLAAYQHGQTAEQEMATLEPPHGGMAQEDLLHRATLAKMAMASRQAQKQILSDPAHPWYHPVAEAAQQEQDQETAQKLAKGELQIAPEGMQRLRSNEAARHRFESSPDLDLEQKKAAIAQTYDDDARIRRGAMPLPPEQIAQQDSTKLEKFKAGLPDTDPSKPYYQWDREANQAVLPRGHQVPEFPQVPPGMAQPHMKLLASQPGSSQPGLNGQPAPGQAAAQPQQPQQDIPVLADEAAYYAHPEGAKFRMRPGGPTYTKPLSIEKRYEKQLGHPIPAELQGVPLMEDPKTHHITVDPHAHDAILKERAEKQRIAKEQFAEDEKARNAKAPKEPDFEARWKRRQETLDKERKLFSETLIPVSHWSGDTKRKPTPEEINDHMEEFEKRYKDDVEAETEKWHKEHPGPARASAPGQAAPAQLPLINSEEEIKAKGLKSGDFFMGPDNKKHQVP
jgi:hypothetical protein